MMKNIRNRGSNSMNYYHACWIGCVLTSGSLSHRSFNLGAVPDDISGEQFVLHICKQIDNMGRLRLQFKLFHKPLFGWKGSFFYTSGCEMIYDMRRFFEEV
ncbi:unnamed protein product [Cylicocyclus nassatus]|uniref:Uncharacterized protein n=1 Tax=Cylicocyclus nassatus TaxID=53992 RepID=A0AA36GTP4_CYLNA|nr:unnamed protein product [Cylicocyclus nassatus]